MSWTDKT